MEGAICRVVEKIIAIDPDCINLFNFSLVFFFLRSFIVAEAESAVTEENRNVVAKVKVLRSFIVAEPEFAVSEENSDVIAGILKKEQSGIGMILWNLGNWTVKQLMHTFCFDSLESDHTRIWDLL
ncbi:hypothetical protein LINPERPRIM_LOCUS42623 [Linum perenne]